MIKLSVFYPNGEDKKFDKEYYLDVHMPLSIKLQGDAIKHVEVDFGFSGGMPGSKAPYVAVVIFYMIHLKHFRRRLCRMQKL